MGKLCLSVSITVPSPIPGGYSITMAGDGQEALKVLEEQTFDLVLRDVQMPGMDGFETAAAIREGEKKTGTHLPVIAMTASAMKGAASGV